MPKSSIYLSNLFKSLFKNRELTNQLIRREVTTKYKGSYLGIVWSFVTPLLMLIIYTYVFSVIFKAKWDFSVTDSKQEFALTLFCGMIVFSLFSECVNKSPGLIHNNPNYVKKVVFPLEIMPFSLLGGAIINFAIGLSILILMQLIIMHTVFWTIIYIPLIILPMAVLSLGLSYALSSLGVYLRDIEHTINVVVQALYLLTPIFYPLTAIPESFRGFILLNPITGIVDNMRRVVVWGMQPDFYSLSIQLIIALIILQLGYAWFVKTRKGFADVI